MCECRVGEHIVHFGRSLSVIRQVEVGSAKELPELPPEDVHQRRGECGEEGGNHGAVTTEGTQRSNLDHSDVFWGAGTNIREAHVVCP